MLAQRRPIAAVGAGGLALTALLGVGGAAARPGGVWLGVPGAWRILLVLVAVGLLAWVSRRSSGLAASAGLLAPVALLVLGVPLAGVRALSGPPLFALALAGAVLVASGLSMRLPRLVFLPAAFAVLCLFASRSAVEVGPRGDEPHYLMVAESLRRDGDLSLEGDYAAQRYTTFHDAPLAPHYRVRGRGGAIYSLHAVGLSVLILPAWALAGYPGVTVFMALVAALLACEVREWVRDLSGRADLADAAGVLLVLSAPLAHYAGLVFTEVPAALAVAFGLRRARAARLGPGGAIAIALSAALLPWLNVRYAPLALLVAGHAAWRHYRRPRLLLALAVPLVASAVGLALYHQALYGFWDPRRVYGRRPELSLGTLADGLPGLFFDQEFGLLVYAPVLAVALPGLLALWRRDRRLAVVSVLSLCVVVLTAGSWHMWRGGFNPPGRFLVPVVPILAVAAALVFERRGVTAGAALLVGWGVWTGLLGGLEPRLVHRDRDGTAPLFRVESGAREWTALLPGYVLEEPDRRRLTAVWAVALVAALPWRRRPAAAWRLGAACLGLVAAAELAVALTHATTTDRDAVRLVGRPAVAVPGFRIVPDCPGEWSASGLGWGPLYEPHRFPGGAEVGSRLPLPQGRYRLVIAGEDLEPGGPAPTLVVAPDRPGAPPRFSPLSRVGGAFLGDFEVRSGEPGVSLRILGGGPILLNHLHLTAQPPRPGTV